MTIGPVLYHKFSTSRQKSQYPTYYNMAQQSHIICLKNPYFEPYSVENHDCSSTCIKTSLMLSCFNYYGT